MVPFSERWNTDENQVEGQEQGGDDVFVLEFVESVSFEISKWKCQKGTCIHEAGAGQFGLEVQICTILDIVLNNIF